jgi:hypothetical protein
MPKDEITQALEDLIDAIVEATGEDEAAVSWMLKSEMDGREFFSRLDGSYENSLVRQMRLALAECEAWFLEPPLNPTPGLLAFSKRSRLYFKMLDCKKKEKEITT